MKERVNQLFKDKLVLVMLVLGLLTIVAAAGAVRIRKGAQNMEESPYLEIKEPEVSCRAQDVRSLLFSFLYIDHIQ